MATTTSADLKFLCAALVVPVLLVIVLSVAFGALSAVFVSPGSAGGQIVGDQGVAASWNLSLAIVVTSFVCLPLFIMAVLRHFCDR